MLTLEFATHLADGSCGWAWAVRSDTGELLTEQSGALLSGSVIPVAVWPWLPLGYGLRWLTHPAMQMPSFRTLRIIGTSDVIAVLQAASATTDAEQARAYARCTELISQIKVKYKADQTCELNNNPLTTDTARQAWESAAETRFRSRVLPTVPSTGHQS